MSRVGMDEHEAVIVFHVTTANRAIGTGVRQDCRPRRIQRPVRSMQSRPEQDCIPDLNLLGGLEEAVSQLVTAMKGLQGANAAFYCLQVLRLLTSTSRVAA